MKKTLSVLLLAGVFAVSTVACKKDKKEDCGALETAVSEKGSAYASNQSSANCNAYKSALSSYVNSSCAELTQAEKDQFNAMITALDCQ
jgi:protein involved in sex pheromone biosynthesis